MSLFVFLLVLALICILVSLGGFLAIRKEEKYKSGFGRRLNGILFAAVIGFCILAVILWFNEFRRSQFIYVSFSTALFYYKVELFDFLQLHLEKVLALYFSLSYFLYSKRTKERTAFYTVFSLISVFDVVTVLSGVSFRGTVGALLFLGRYICRLSLIGIVIFQTVFNFISLFKKGDQGNSAPEPSAAEGKTRDKPRLKGVFASASLVVFSVATVLVSAVSAFAVAVFTSEPYLVKSERFEAADASAKIEVCEVNVSRGWDIEKRYVIYLNEGLFAKKVHDLVKLSFRPTECEVLWKEDEAVVVFRGLSYPDKKLCVEEYTVSLKGEEK
jgi:hypothetical protein